MYQERTDDSGEILPPAAQEIKDRMSAREELQQLVMDRSFQSALRAGVAVLLLVGAILLVAHAWVVFQPLIVSVFLAVALWPWVSRISAVRLGPRRWRMPRILSATAIYLGTLISTGLIVWILLAGILPQIDRLLASYPQQTSFISDYLAPFRAGDIAGGAAKVAGDVAREAAGAGNTAGAPTDQSQAVSPISIGALAVGLFGGVVTLVLVLVFTFFLLLDGDRFAQWILMILPKSDRPHARMVGLEIRDRVSRWVLAQATYAAVSAAVMAGGMLALQIPNPWLYGVFSAVLALLPGIGPAAAAIPAIFVAMDLAPWQPAAVALFGALVYLLDGAFFVPRIYGGVMQLPMFVVLVATLLGADLMGVWGAMIASPVAVTLQIILRDQFRKGINPGSA